MNRLSTSYERSGGELAQFGIGALGVLMGICGVIFNQPALGILGVVVLLVTLATSLQRSAED